jgi:Uri superfamily endonuclease
LLIEVPSQLVLEVGRLGRQVFQPGRYAYLGSALGPGGVAARLKRHLRPNKTLHWHIDHLTAAARIVGAGAAYGTVRQECLWAMALQAGQGAYAPAPGFGSSDCRSGCGAHLFRLPVGVTVSWIEDELTRCPIQAI